MSEKYEATGQIINIGEIQSFASGFTKRVVVIETEKDSKYPQQVPFEAMKDKAADLDNYSVGDTVKVSFNLRGNEHKGKYYCSVSIWKIELLEKGNLGATSPDYGRRSANQNTAPPPRQQPPSYPQDNDPEEEIPF